MRIAMTLLGLFGLFVLYVAVNVFISQNANPLFFRIVSLQEPQAAREFLANLEGTDYYTEQEQYLNSHFNNVFAQELSIQQLNNTKAIAEFEKVLALNPQSRDALVQLALLHESQGNTAQAAAYYKTAREIDPWLQVQKLEDLEE